MALVLALTIVVPIINAGEHRSYEAHEHGVAHLNVAVAGSDLMVEFSSPAANIVGFEHHPRSQAQKDQVKEAKKKLTAAKALFQMPAQAQVQLVKSAVHTDIDHDLSGKSDELHNHEPGGEHEKAHKNDENGGHDHQDKEHAHERHSDFKAEYHFVCKNLKKLAYMDVLLFRAFPAIERIEVQILTATKQTARELTAEDNRFSF